MWTRLPYIYIYSLFVNMKSIGPHFLGQFNIWTWPLSRGNYKKIEIFVTWPFLSCYKFFKICNFSITCYMGEKGVTFEHLGSLSKFRWSPSSSKLEGPHKVILGDFPFFMEEATCTLISPNSIWSSYAQPSPWSKGKNSTQIGHHMWKILASKFGS